MLVSFIYTRRLVLQPLEESHTDELFAIRSDPETMAYWDWPHDNSVVETTAILRSHLCDMRAGLALYYAATDHFGTFIGIFDLSELNGSVPDVGFLVRRTSWGCGYGIEGTGAVVTEAWRRGYRRVKARVHAANERSIALLQRLGFKESAALSCLEVRPGVHKACRNFVLEALE